MVRQVAAPYADGVYFGYVLRRSHQSGIGPKGLPVKSMSRPATITRTPLSASCRQTSTSPGRRTASSMPTTSTSEVISRMFCAPNLPAWERIALASCETTPSWSSAHRSGGLKISTRRRARIRGPLQAADQLSVLPENIEPHITSIQPFWLAFSKRHIITTLLRFLIPDTGRSLLFDPGDPGSEALRRPSMSLVTAVDLFDVLDRARTFGAHRRDQQRHTRTDVGRSHARSPQPHLVVMSDHRRAMGVAEDDWAPMSISLSTKNRRLSNIFW